MFDQLGRGASVFEPSIDHFGDDRRGRNLASGGHFDLSACGGLAMRGRTFRLKQMAALDLCQAEFHFDLTDRDFRPSPVVGVGNDRAVRIDARRTDVDVIAMADDDVGLEAHLRGPAVGNARPGGIVGDGITFREAEALVSDGLGQARLQSPQLAELGGKLMDIRPGKGAADELGARTDVAVHVVAAEQVREQATGSSAFDELADHWPSSWMPSKARRRRRTSSAVDVNNRRRLSMSTWLPLLRWVAIWLRFDVDLDSSA